jgi:hypothetical protein
VLRIRDVDPGSDFFPSRIPDPICSHPRSRIRIKEFKYFNPKKWFLSSRKYDLDCSSRIRILTFYLSQIPDPGVKKAPDPGSGSAKLILSMKNDENLPSKSHNTLIFVKKNLVVTKKGVISKFQMAPFCDIKDDFIITRHIYSLAYMKTYSTM